MVWFPGKSASAAALPLRTMAKGLSFLYAWSLEAEERTVGGSQPFAVVNCSWQVSLFPKQFNKGSCKTTAVLAVEGRGNGTTQLLFAAESARVHTLVSLPVFQSFRENCQSISFF